MNKKTTKIVAIVLVFAMLALPVLGFVTSMM